MDSWTVGQNPDKTYSISTLIGLEISALTQIDTPNSAASANRGGLLANLGAVGEVIQLLWLKAPELLKWAGQRMDG